MATSAAPVVTPVLAATPIVEIAPSPKFNKERT